MCGICGFWSRDAGVLNDARAVLTAMSEEIAHRGPDASGRWVDPKRGVGFGHRRLSIIDLSPRGRQPMESADRRWVVTYNGELYNYRDLRAELGGKWRGDSDTEVLVEAIARWGVAPAVRRFVGMFAFAAFDRERGELVLVRDRLGIKPLYWGRVGRDLVFASELTPLRRYPGFGAEIDRDVLSMYMRTNCVPSDRCILQGFHKVLPGHVVTFDASDAAPHSTPFWDAGERRAALRGSFRGDERDAIDALDERLFTAVRDRLVADVPLGAFLSGGVDSSTVVAMMQRASADPVRTFSIGFEDDAYDEAAHARAVAGHLGTRHTELYVTPQQALAVVPRLGRLFDEPFADSSQIPTFLVSQLAREQVTVSLSGDGGDELFAGYNRHVWGPRVMRGIERVPRSARRLAARAMLAVPASTWDRVFARLRVPVRLPTEKLEKLATVIPAPSDGELYRTLRSHWRDPAEIVVGGTSGQLPLRDVDGDFVERMMFWDLTTYLPDDILTKVDRASMAVALEARVPLIDHRVVELAWSLPADVKLRGGVTKWVLREVLDRYVPRELIDRPKMGFGIPIDRWLRGPLRPWAEELLDARRLEREGFLRPEPIRRRFMEHLEGRRNWHHHLWNVLMFQAWLEAWRS